MVVLFGWPYIYNYFWPPSPRPVPPIVTPTEQAQQPQPGVEQPASPAPAPPQDQIAAQQPQAEIQEIIAVPRDITISTPYWNVVLSSTGAVAKSWVLHHYKENGGLREIKNSKFETLELLPQEIHPAAPKPFALRIAAAHDVQEQLNAKNFAVEGAGADENHIDLAEGSRAITFRYESTNAAGARVIATKTFEFHADRMYFDVKADVVRQENNQSIPQAVELFLGPRIGDQSDEQTSSYGSPSQVVAYTTDGSRDYFLPPSITQQAATIVEVRPNEKQIIVDSALPAGLGRIKLVTDSGVTFIDYARVTKDPVQVGEDRFALTIEDDKGAFPASAQAGLGVAPAIELQKKPYRWAGISDHYFAMIAVPDQPIGEIALANVHTKATNPNGIDYPAVAIPVRADVPTHIFVGPKDSDLLTAVEKSFGPDTNLGELIDYGFFSFMVRPLIPVLAFSFESFAKLFNNYGWAIVLTTVLINLLMSPLRFQSSKKMKKAAKHQPEIKRLQEEMKKLKENPKKNEAAIRKLQERQIAIMKEANPLGGCLPLLLQLPIFWAVYLYLYASLDVRHAEWLYLKDLSRPDPTFILPIVMCVSMIASTKLTPQPAQADPSMKMQRIMMTWLMPILLTWLFFFSAPSGLVLYWMVSNLVGVAIQLWINKRTAEPEAAPPAGKTGAPVTRPAVVTAKAGTDKRGKPRAKNKQRGGAEAEGF